MLGQAQAAPETAANRPRVSGLHGAPHGTDPPGRPRPHPPGQWRGREPPLQARFDRDTRDAGAGLPLRDRLAAIGTRGGAPRDVTLQKTPIGPRAACCRRGRPRLAMGDPRRGGARRYRFTEGPAALALRIPEVPRGGGGHRANRDAERDPPFQRRVRCVSGAGLAVRHVRVALRRGPGPVSLGAPEQPPRQAGAGGTAEQPHEHPLLLSRGGIIPVSAWVTRCGCRSVPVSASPVWWPPSAGPR